MRTLLEIPEATFFVERSDDRRDPTQLPEGHHGLNCSCRLADGTLLGRWMKADPEDRRQLRDRTAAMARAMIRSFNKRHPDRHLDYTLSFEWRRAMIEELLGRELDVDLT